MPPVVLFVCTGNYYRSRFAEHLFSVRAARAGLRWRADSGGLALSPHVNVGPVSDLVVRGLRERGLPPVRRHRSPRRVTDVDLGAAGLIVVLDGRQHRSAFCAAHRAHLRRVEWWDVPDVHEMDASDALARIDERVADLVARLRVAAGPPRGRPAPVANPIPVVRDAVRVLLLDPRDRVLLLRYDATDGGAAVWAPPGGGLEPGEDHLAAAWRELAEELTDRPHDVVEIGPWIWVRESLLRVKGVPTRQRERWYLARARAAIDPDATRRARLADEGVLEVRWWTSTELDAERPRTAPSRLHRLLPDLVAGRLPGRPVDVGV